VSEEDAVGGGGGFSSAMLKKKVERVNQLKERESVSADQSGSSPS
jgi:hypothetical protein